MNSIQLAPCDTVTNRTPPYPSSQKLREGDEAVLAIGDFGDSTIGWGELCTHSVHKSPQGALSPSPS